MRRRRFIALLGCTAGSSIAAFAQQTARPLVGWLNSTSPDENPQFLPAFRDGLSQTGWVEGQNVAIEYRWADGQYDRLPALAADLVAHKVDVIVTGGGTPAAWAAKKATPTIPVVFVGIAYPVETGLVASLARPGGNLTGFSIIGGELTPKRLEMLHELVPSVTTIAMLVDPNLRGGNVHFSAAIEDVATKIGVRVPLLEARAPGDFETAFAKVRELGAGALVVDAGPLFASRRKELLALASRYTVPVSYFEPEFAEAGGLISYGPRLATAFREAGIYVGKILHGAKPAELPVQQPTKFELIINMKTAKRLGLTVPQVLLAQADEIIE